MNYDMLISSLAIGVGIFHCLGFLSVFSAIMNTRTSQGAIAWALALITLPYFALPLYWVFGRRHFQGYVKSRRVVDQEIHDLVPHLQITGAENVHAACDHSHTALERLARTHIMDGNDADLLIDGEATFASILEAIEDARDYILIQFFIVHDDGLGTRIQETLLRKAREGVRVYFLYDEIGSYHLPQHYVDTLRRGDVHITGFRTTRGPRNKFQINFRNHRKIVITDGTVGFIGGLNIGDEYLGKDPRFGRWRDTHVRVTGPAVQAIQLSFVEDWYWATRSNPDLTWVPRPSPTGNKTALVISSGPSDPTETCGLFYVHCINTAQKRLWIASPYFVPDERIIGALNLAALRGVDVRIMLPEKPDHYLIYLASFYFINEVETSGIKFYRYSAGFMHQKVMLIDDNTASVGTANLDNRSFRLNFEITLLFLDTPFAKEIESMLLDDFRDCEEVPVGAYHTKPLWFRFGVRISRLLAPIQ